MYRTTVIIFTALWISACNSDNKDESEEPVGNSYSQCTNHPNGVADDIPEVVITIDRLVPADVEIHCSDNKTFTFNGREVSLTYIAYGELNDCVSGCFSSFVCGIYDPDESLLYASTWYGSNEEPLSIPQDCPELAGGENGNTTQCDTPPQGFQHPITTTTEFEAFKAAQLEQSGDWRFCFSEQ
jgi:hypothetical protein